MDGTELARARELLESLLNNVLPPGFVQTANMTGHANVTIHCAGNGSFNVPQ